MKFVKSGKAETLLSGLFSFREVEVVAQIWQYDLLRSENWSEWDWVICDGWLQFQKSRILETKNLSTDTDSSTNIFVSALVKKGAADQGAF